MNCPICKNTNLEFLCRFIDGPAMQNKLYDSLENALREKKQVLFFTAVKIVVLSLMLILIQKRQNIPLIMIIPKSILCISQNTSDGQ